LSDRWVGRGVIAAVAATVAFGVAGVPAAADPRFTSPSFVVVSMDGMATTYQVVDGDVVAGEPVPVSLAGPPELGAFAGEAVTGQSCESEFVDLDIGGVTVTVPTGSHAVSQDGTRLAYLRSSVQASGACEQAELVVRDIASGVERVWDAYFPELVTIDGPDGPTEVTINGGGIVTELAWSPSGLLAYGTYDAGLWVLDPAASGETIRSGTGVRVGQEGWQYPAWLGDDLVATAVHADAAPLQVVDATTGATVDTLVPDTLYPIAGDTSGQFLLYLRGAPDTPEVVLRTRAGTELTVAETDAYTVFWS
jgi:hypothetical protein